MLKNINIKFLRHLVIGSCSFLLLFISCKSASHLTSTKGDLSAIYNPNKSILHPGFKVYHNEKSTSLVFFKVYSSELSFQPKGEGGDLMCDVDLEFTLFESAEEGGRIVDTGTYNYILKKEDTGKYFLTQVPFKAELGKSYNLKLIVTDNLQKKNSLTFLEVEKNNSCGQQFYNLTNSEGEPIFRNVIIGNGTFKVNYANPISQTLFVSYYKNEVQAPKPTFASPNQEVMYKNRDSLFVIEYDPDQPISLAYEGMYHIQFDTNATEGVSITRFHKGFPKVSDPDDLIEPLSYLTTIGEYNRMSTQTNHKLAVDDFWIKCGGEVNRGREMLRVYYNRVYFANYYFTNSIAGWKTDRGMVYVVYGPPHVMKKTIDKEIWQYTRKGSGGEVISFEFNYTPGRYHLNQYNLKRSDNNTWHWKEAVYTWRNGEIFLLE